MPKNQTNRLGKSNASSKLSQGRNKNNGNNSSRRSAETIQRLQMYKSGKLIRNKQGQAVGGTFQMPNRSGDTQHDASTGRIQPDRRWFGNTRTVEAGALDNFRQAMAEQSANPYSVVLKRHKLPMGLLKEAAITSTKRGLLEQEPFERTFGKQSSRKRVKLDQLFVARSSEQQDKQALVQDQAQPVSATPDNGYAALLNTAQASHEAYHEINTRPGLVTKGRDGHLESLQDWRPMAKDDLFSKGQSKRIWGEFFKVLDCSDVVLHVIDARNVPGTRCTMIEKHITNNAKHKHLVFVLNKIDLVPNWVAKRWMGELAAVRPTIAFHASLTHAFGKGALMNLLRQFGKLHVDKKEISVGVVGYPNVGKSSVINTLLGQASCHVAPIPGETKIWQYVRLFKRISLIDCPGVVVDTAGDTETDSVLKGVVRAERLEHPQDYVPAILDKVQRQHIAAQYKIEDSWKDDQELLEMIALKFGRLLKGGDVCVRSAAVMLIYDFQRGRLPHYVAPPELKNDNIGQQQQVQPMKQDLDAIGCEHMHDDDETSLDEKQKQDKTDAPEETEETAEKEEPEPTREDAGPSSQDLIGAGDWED